MKLARVRGIEIRIDPSWVFLLALVTWSLALGFLPGAVPGIDPVRSWAWGLVGACMMFASVLLHELAHSIVGRALGVEISGITLFLFGGVARLKREPETPWAELWMTLAGPSMSFLLAGLSFGLLGSGILAGSAPLVASLQYIAWVNLVLGLFNLLPGFPLDGGRIVRALLWWGTGDLRRATWIACLCGQAIGGLLALQGVLELILGALGGLWLVMIGWFIIGAARQSWAQVRIREALEGTPVGQLMEQAYPRIQPETTIQELIERGLVRGFRKLPVWRGEELSGWVGREEVRGLDPSSWSLVPVSRVMAPAGPDSRIGAGEDAWRALERMGEGEALVVTREGAPVGLLSRDALAALIELRAGAGR